MVDMKFIVAVRQSIYRCRKIYSSILIALAVIFVGTIILKLFPQLQKYLYDFVDYMEQVIGLRLH